MIYSKYVKRFLSIILSLIGIIIASPVMLIVAVLVRVKIGSPILFVQERPGYRERIFKLRKFRTMTNAVDENGELLPDDQRQTKLGRFLRKTSLDELPELFNILKGDMAFIGPRPLLVNYLDYYTPEQHRRHNVRPGMANISAIKGRNCIEWEERFKLDTWYADHVSFMLDAKIFFQTIYVVVFRKGADGSDRLAFDDVMKAKNGNGEKK